MMRIDEKSINFPPMYICYRNHCSFCKLITNQISPQWMSAHIVGCPRLIRSCTHHPVWVKKRDRSQVSAMMVHSLPFWLFQLLTDALYMSWQLNDVVLASSNNQFESFLRQIKVQKSLTLKSKADRLQTQIPFVVLVLTVVPD